MRHTKTRKRAAPEEIKRLKRDLGLDRIKGTGVIQNYVRLEKTVGSTQTVGGDNEPVVSWQEAQRDIGGGADVAGNRFVVPAGKSGLWRLRATLHLSSGTVNVNSNYRVSMTRNGSEFCYANNQSSATRAFSPRLQEERYLAENDVVQVKMLNSTDLTQPNPGVDIIEGSHATFEFMGIIEE